MSRKKAMILTKNASGKKPTYVVLVKVGPNSEPRANSVEAGTIELAKTPGSTRREDTYTIMKLGSHVDVEVDPTNSTRRITFIRAKVGPKVKPPTDSEVDYNAAASRPIDGDGLLLITVSNESGPETLIDHILKFEDEIATD